MDASIWLIFTMIVCAGVAGFAIGLGFGVTLWAGYIEEEDKIKKENE